MNELEELLAQYRDMKVELAYPLEVLKTLEKKIKAHVKENGEVAEIEGARIIVRPSKPRDKWDHKGLKALAERDARIMRYYEQVTYSPSIMIVPNGVSGFTTLPCVPIIPSRPVTFLL